MTNDIRISSRLRFEVLRRDGHTCRYCGAKAPAVPLTVDHVVPRVLGGRDEPSNLVTACAECNAGKSSTPPDAAVVADVDADAMRWADAMSEVARRREAARPDLVQFEEAWANWTTNDGTDPVPIPANWRHTIEGYIAEGLDVETVVRFVPVAMESRATPDNTFAYLCGCCKNEIMARQNEARALIEGGEI